LSLFYENPLVTTKGKKGKGKVVPVLNQVPRHEDVLGARRCRSTHS